VIDYTYAGYLSAFIHTLVYPYYSYFPDAVTLSGVYNGGSASTRSRDLLQWAVGWQQQHRRTLLVLSVSE